MNAQYVLRSLEHDVIGNLTGMGTRKRSSINAPNVPESTREFMSFVSMKKGATSGYLALIISSQKMVVREGLWSVKKANTCSVVTFVTRYSLMQQVSKLTNFTTPWMVIGVALVI